MKNQFCILSLSKSSWFYPFWTSRQCLMYELAAHCNVFYLNEREYWRNLAKTSFWTNRRTQQKIQPFEPPDNLFIIDPSYRYPYFYGKSGFNNFFKKKLISKITKIIHKQCGLPLYAYVWHPSCLEYLKDLKPSKIIYHPYDKFSEFENDPSTKKKILQTEQKIVKTADVVITPHARIAETLGHPNTHVISNAVFSPAFQNSGRDSLTQPPDIFVDIPSPRIGYIGGINKKVDFQLLSEISTHRPEWSIILMGPHLNKEIWCQNKHYLSLNERKNVYFFDAVNFNNVATYMRWFDIGCMPYATESWMSFCQSPLKLYQYWALGKPVISSPLPNLTPEPGTLSMGTNSHEWINAIEWELKNDCKKFRRKRKQLAELNSWKDKASKIYNILNKLN